MLFRSLRIIGNGAILDGSISLDNAPWEHVRNDVFKYSPPLKGFQVLLLEGKFAPHVSSQNSKLPLLKVGQWSWFEGAIHLKCQPNHLPSGMSAACGGLSVGITLYDVHDVEISDLTVRGFQLDGVNAHDNVRRTTLANLTSELNGRSGITIAGASRVRVESCLCRDNGQAQFRTEGYCIAQISGNQFEAGSAPASASEGGQVVEVPE